MLGREFDLNCESCMRGFMVVALVGEEGVDTDVTVVTTAVSDAVVVVIAVVVSSTIVIFYVNNESVCYNISTLVC